MPRFLVTAGNTRERIDRVRDWGNIFTGNTGFNIARAIAPHGDVDLLTSNAAHAAEAAAHGISAGTFRSHDDLREALRQRVTTTAYDAIFMTAAVADYTPVRTYAVQAKSIQADGSEIWVVCDAQAGKVKSTHSAIAVLGERTEKLVDKFRRDWGFNRTLVKFKLEVGLTQEELIAVASASRTASGADYLIANTLDMVTGDAAGAFLLSDREPEWVARAELAQRCARIAAESVLK
jgi:phosphopantothenoylcysteine synthetase/decarboxylase